jgi:polyisoprenoid-binding protein YceI
MALLGLAALTFAGVAHAALGRASNAAVSFLGVGPAGLKIEGKTRELSVSEQAGKVHFVVPLANVDTGIGLRNKHMREKYLEVSKYPTAELVVDRAALKIPADGQDATGQANGRLTIHGQTKPVAVSYRAKKSGAGFDISGAMRVNINEYGINIPSYLGVTMKPDVDVALSARVED